MIQKEQIDRWFADKEEMLTAALARLIAIPSVRGEAQSGMPFGEGPAAALEEGMAIAREWGLTAACYDGYVGCVDLNEKEDQLHILAHLDVVPAGDGWDTDPFALARRDGVLYGRGVSDDKGPAVAALLAMRAARELGGDLPRNARLILGTDEETGMEDVKYYYSKEPHAPYAVTPDAQFPVINTEKGHYRVKLTRQWEESVTLPRIKSLAGGERLNVVPHWAQAMLEGMDPKVVEDACRLVLEATGCGFQITQAGERVCLTATGAAAHAANPDNGVNAITGLIAALCAMPFADSPAFRTVKALNRMFPHGDNHGHALGIDMEDEISGRITVNLALINLNETGMACAFDSRTPLCANEDNCAKVAAEAFEEMGFQWSGKMGAPHHVPQESEFIQCLLRQYENYIGKPGKCMSMGGGTYVHDIPGGVAFGAEDPEYDTRMHCANERMRLADLMTMAKIYTHVILELCG